METETKRLTAEIIKIYPEMFQGTDPNYTPWSAGLGVDLGWYPIIKRLVTTIKENDDQYNLENGTKVVTKVFDIKEKYGSLRFHPVGGTSDKNWDAIEAAENESEKLDQKLIISDDAYLKASSLVWEYYKIQFEK